ncbi:17-beta-hydroxysteroid dehydrogenase 13 [Pseudocercospora fuligena]|uniref:17-beta-hydroxysteroid dehydrogenase 13 n=1 Tax=Pseudocercospora fuligena TaxID=685502 RepID=A0A8H6VRZ2_9PEZI|nr:17-beta-hydroxysteroid dehydrogenase 13 [Pseudocercospora fuligena]
MEPVLVVLGSGPGIGVSTAKLFAQKYFSKIALVSRNAERLDKERTEVVQAAAESGRTVEVDTFVTDLGDLTQLRQTLSKIEKLGPIGCVFFNAARIRPSEILSTSVEEIEEDFRLTNIGLYVVAQWAIPLLRKSQTTSPSLIVTSSALPENPIPVLLSLSAVKASQQNIVHSLRTVFGKDVHIGVIKVAGQVGPSEENLNPANIARQTVAFYERPREQWDTDAVILP